MATSTFLPGSSTHLSPRTDLSFGGLASVSASNTQDSPSQQHAAYLPAAFGAHQLKLPSLEGLLKKMQDEPVSPPSRAQYSPAALSLADFSERAYAQHHRLSPAGRERTQMPALRAIISPSTTKNAVVPAHSGFLHTMSFPLDASHQHMAFPSRKRSWTETTGAVTTEAAFYPSKERAVSPVSSVGSITTTNSSGPQRSRASKYCKIEGCERVSQRNNLCHSHGGKRLCKEDGCSSKDRGNGYCIKHGGGKICSMESCEKKARRKGLCTQHFRVGDDEVSESGDAI